MTTHEIAETQAGSLFSRVVLAVVATLTLPVAMVAHKGLALLFALAAVAILARAVVTRSTEARFGPFAASYTALIVYAALSAIWSIAPVEAFDTVPSMAAMGLGGVLLVSAAYGLHSRDLTAIRTIVAIAGIVGYALFAFEIATDEIIFRTTRDLFKLPLPDFSNYALTLNAAFSIAAVFFWPWVAALRRAFSLPYAAVGAAAAAAVLYFSESDAPKFAVVVGVLLAVIAFAFPRRVRILTCVAVTLGIAAMPYVATILPNPLVSIKHAEFLSPSAQHRLVIWRTTVDHIKKRPILGNGFDTARSLYSGKDAVLLHFQPDEPDKTWANFFAPIPLHPHNGVLQVWLELGGVGALILAVLLIAIVLAIERAVTDRFDKAITYGAFGGGLFIALVSFGAWQNWWLCGLFLCTALMAAVVTRATSIPTA